MPFKFRKKNMKEVGKKTATVRVEKKASGESTRTEVRDQDSRTVIKTGFARRGDLIATMKPAVLGKEGKNTLGEKVLPKEVQEPRLVSGRNVRVEKGTHYFMETDGIVEVLKDEKGIFYIRGKLYKRGRCSIFVSEDEMKATLTVTPPIGGAEPVQVEDVLAEADRRGVVFGLKEQVIQETVENALKERMVISDVVIAEGEGPLHGSDGRIEFKLLRASGSAVTVLGDGRVDFKEQDLVTRVEEGQLLVVLKKAQGGVKDGHTVKGEAIKALAGRDVELGAGNNIRIEDKGNELHYYSTLGGQLILDDQSISVEQMLVINGDVGPKTGNIRFEGIVHIKGNINDNYNVFSRKDITVEGNVGNAIVKTDQNLIIKNGVLGKNRGIISAGGDVTVKFAENSNIRAGENIIIQRAALNCKLTAGKKIISTMEKGQIISGELRAKMGVEVKLLGNESEQKMDVLVGTDFSLEESLNEMKLKLQKYEMALRKIVLLLQKINQVNPDPEKLPEKLKKMYQDARKKGTIAKIAISEIKKKESSILMELDRVIESDVIAHDSMYRGVRIHFGKLVYEPEDTKTNIRVYYNKEYERIDIGRIP